MENKWICRMWTKNKYGWMSEFERFASQEEAVEHGNIHKNLIRRGELMREFEVYKEA